MNKISPESNDNHPFSFGGFLKGSHHWLVLLCEAGERRPLCWSCGGWFCAYPALAGLTAVLCLFPQGAAQTALRV